MCYGNKLMTKERLEKRLEEIESSMQQAQANFNVLEGAKKEVMYWLDILSQETESIIEDVA